MITQGNTKLGPWIWGWSIPAFLTCPGASLICQLLCYAMRGRFKTGNVKAAHVRNLELAKSPNFVPAMNTWIQQHYVLLLRVHVAGDFFGKRYIKKWIQIVRQNPGTKFYAYTRSWAVPELLPLLVELGREPNFEMWFSWDKSMPFPPKRKGIRTCYLSQDDTDWPSRKTDLVFREESETVMKKDPKGNMICPYENGVTPTTCSRCKLCWTSNKKEQAQPFLELLEAS